MKQLLIHPPLTIDHPSSMGGLSIASLITPVLLVFQALLPDFSSHSRSTFSLQDSSHYNSTLLKAELFKKILAAKRPIFSHYTTLLAALRQGGRDYRIYRIPRTNNLINCVFCLYENMLCVLIIQTIEQI